MFRYRHLVELILLTVHLSVRPVFDCSCAYLSRLIRITSRWQSCWNGRHRLIHMWPRRCFFALCGRGRVWKLGRCHSQTCADKYFRERTSPHLSASGHRASAPLTHSHMKYGYKQANTLMRTKHIKELQSTGNLSLLPTALTPTAATSQSSTWAKFTVIAQGKGTDSVSRKWTTCEFIQRVMKRQREYKCR